MSKKLLSRNEGIILLKKEHPKISYASIARVFSVAQGYRVSRQRIGKIVKDAERNDLQTLS